MAACPACSSSLAETQRFCPFCGAPVAEASALSTGTAPKPGPDSPRTPIGSRRPRSVTASGLHLSSTAAAEGGRFTPGELLNERYRVIGLLGKGGMGEVYRADDLTLDQSVALKFLPERLTDDPDRLGRFFNEVRVAREITHPSVCRVHDIGDVDGQPFLSMEYVDGENLASLLRRIGRLPSDKILEIARQVCAGVAAAHDKGVLHRDLKPDNIMLDGRGRVRITDFGLAGLAEEITSAEVRSGTPAYMAPEQLAGKEVTVRSDVYALGLVLYELFTGRRVFDGKSLAELTRMHLAEDPKPPSELVPDLDPTIERVILRCLAKDPAKRPASALQVSAALPGGDPLAAALAAGETPSPEMVAAAGQEGGLRPALAWPALVVTLVGVLASVVLGEATRLTHIAPHDKSPAALEDRSRDLLEELGASETVADSAYGLFTEAAFLLYWAPRDATVDRWKILERGRPPVSQFWYRQSPRPLVSTNNNGFVSGSDPPSDVSGMAGVWLDFDGRLVRFYAVPPQLEDRPPASAPEPDWATLFELAGLDWARFEPVQTKWAPPFYCDRRAAWEGTYPEAPDIEIRVEAAAYRGRLVYFRTVGDWSRAERMTELSATLTRPQLWGGRLGGALFVTICLAAAFLCWRNLRLGRGDRRGALRLAGLAFAAGLLEWLLRAHHVTRFPDEVGLFFQALAVALLAAASLWVLYVALEPYVRRRWPDTLISWTRLLAGSRRDPLVGTHVLLGTLAGVLWAMLFVLIDLLPVWLGLPPGPPTFSGQEFLLGSRRALGIILGSPANAVAMSLGFLLLLFVLRVLLRSERLAAAVLVVLIAATITLFNQYVPALVMPLFLIIWAIPVVVVLRLGLLALACSFFTYQVLFIYPLGLDFSHWTGATTPLALLAVGLLAGWGFRAALAGRPLFRDY